MYFLSIKRLLKQNFESETTSLNMGHHQKLNSKRMKSFWIFLPAHVMGGVWSVLIDLWYALYMTDTYSYYFGSKLEFYLHVKYVFVFFL